MENTNIDETINKANDKLAEIKAEKRNLEQAKALANTKMETRATKLDWADVGKQLIEKRTLTVGDTEPITIARELAETLQSKQEVLKYVTFNLGAGSNENIPCWGTEIGEPVEVDEAGTLTDKAGTFKVVSLQPKCVGMTIPVSTTALRYSAVDVGASVQNGIQKAYSKKMAKDIFTGTGCVKGILTLDGVNAIEAKTAGTVSISDLANLALAVKDVSDEAIIFISPAIYNSLTCDENSAKEKAYAKSLYNDKMIEGVKVILASQMPSATTAGSKIAVAGNFAEYNIGISGDLEIVEKDNVGKLVHNFDCDMFYAGTAPVPSNFYFLETK